MKFIDRRDCDHLQDLLDIGISEEDAWKEVLSLSAHDYFFDPKPYYRKTSVNALLFKKIINGYLVYIKLKIELYNNQDYTVCLSFHIDYR